MIINTKKENSTNISHNQFYQTAFPRKNDNQYKINENKSIISEQKNNIEKFIDLTNEDSITLHIQSSDQLLNYAIRCKTNNIFSYIVTKILERERSYVEKGFYFLCSGNKINEYKTVKENHLKNEDRIIMQIVD